MLKKAKALGYSFVVIISAAIVLTDLYFRVLAGKELTPIEGAKLVPQEALMAIYISTDSQAWTQFKKVGTPKVQNVVQQKINSWIGQIAVLEGIDYQKRVQPWIGNLMLASLPPDQTVPKNQENWLMVVGIKNKFKAFEFANVIEKQNTKKIQASQYKNIPIVSVTNKKNLTSIVAVLNQYVLVSSQQSTIEKAINIIPSESLASQEASTILSEKTDKDLITQLYFPKYADWLESELSSSEASQISQSSLKPLSQLKSVFVEISIHNQKVCLQAIAKRRSSIKPEVNTSKEIIDNLEKLDLASTNGAFFESILAKLNQLTMMQSLFERRINAEELPKFLFLSLGVSLAEVFQMQPQPFHSQIDDAQSSATDFNLNLPKDHLNSLANLPEAAAILGSIQNIKVKTALERSIIKLDLLLTLKAQGKDDIN